MRLWGKKPSSVEPGEASPYRAFDPEHFDKGAKINRKAVELQRTAADGLTEAEASTAIGTALGNAVAAMVRRHPTLSLNEMLDLACAGVREAACHDAGLPTPRTEREGDLTEKEFNQLAVDLINTATANGTLEHDAMAATARALGTLITFSARRAGSSVEELIARGQQAVATFALNAANFMLENPDSDPGRK